MAPEAVPATNDGPELMVGMGAVEPKDPFGNANTTAAEENASQLSLSERMGHKNWKVRQEAFKEFHQSLLDSNSAIPSDLREHLEAMKKAPLEANAATQEAALGALCAFLKFHDMAQKCRSALVPALLDKGLTAVKPASRSHAIEALMLLADAEGNADVVIQDILPVLATAKQPKVLAAIIMALKEMVKAFGCPSASWRSIVKNTGDSTFGHADKNVRSEAMALAQELYRWGRSPVLQALEGVLRPVQFKELQDACNAINGEAPIPQRGLPREGLGEVTIKTPTAPQDVDIKSVIDEKRVVKDPADDFDSAMSTDILDKMPTDFYELLESPKWKERKEIIDQFLANLKGTKRAEDGRYGELIHVLCRHISSDANVLVVISASQLLELVCKCARHCLVGFRGDPIIPVLLERCKEKKANVVEALRSALDATTLGISSLAEVFDHIVPFLSYKNPTVKSEALQFMQRSLRKLYKKQLGKKEIKAIVDAVLPTLDDSATEVRDAASQALAELIKSYGEASVLPLISEKLDKIKLSKVKDLLNSETPSSHSSKSVPASDTKMAESHAAKKPMSSRDPAPSISNRKSIQGKPPEPNYRFTEADAISYWTENHNTIYNTLGDANWKTRLEAINEFELRLSVEPELAVRICACRPGWRENNLQVLSKAIDILIAFFSQCKLAVGPESVSLLITGLYDKFCEAKLVDGLTKLFNLVGPHSPQCAFSQLLSQTLFLKSPKAAAETLKFLKEFMLDHGLACLPSQSLPGELSVVRQLLNNPNGQVRTAALELASAAKGFHGANKVKEYLGSDLSPALKSSLEAEFGKYPSQLEPRKVPEAPSIQVAKLGGSEKSVATSSPQVDNVPRNDITADLPLILGKLSDSNWKLRKEGLDDLSGLLRHKITCQHVTDLLLALKARFADSNKNLIVQALEVASQLTDSLSASAFDKSTMIKSGSVNGAAACLADNKAQVRQAAVNYLAKLTGIVAPLVMSGLLREELKAENPNSKKELIMLLTSVLIAIDGEDELAIAAVVGCLQDRNGEVRKAVQAAISTVASEKSAEALVKVCQKFHPSLVSNVQSLVKTAPSGKKTMTTTDPAEDDWAFIDDGKAARSDRDKRLPASFWSVEYADKDAQLREFVEEQCPGRLFSQLVNPNPSDELKALMALIALLDKQPLLFLNNIDLVGKYFVVRLPDSNSSKFAKMIELLEAALSAADKLNQRLVEQAVACLIDSLVHKSTQDSTITVQNRIKAIYRQLCRVFPASRLFSIILELSLASQQPKVKCECLAELRVLLSRNGQSVLMQPAKCIDVLVGVILAATAPKDVKRACKEVLAQIQEALGGEAFAKHLEQFATIDRDKLLEELHRPVSVLSTPSKKSALATPTKRMNEPKVEPMEVDAVADANPFAGIEDPFKPKATLNGLNSVISAPIISNTRRAMTFGQDHPLENLIDLLTCTPDLQCIAALEKIHAEFQSKAEDTKAPLLTRMEPLVHALTVRLKEATSNLVVEIKSPEDQALMEGKIQVTHALCTCLTPILEGADFCQELEGGPEDELFFLMEETLQALLRVACQEDMVRVLNGLLLKGLESLSPNKSLRIFIKLLEKAFVVPVESANDKYPDLLIKCLWKLTKQLGAFLANERLSIADLLREIEAFLASIPPMEWRARMNKKLPYEDSPLRTIKTIVHELTNCKGLEVLENALQVLPPSSFTVSYVKTYLQAAHITIPEELLTRTPQTASKNPKKRAWSPRSPTVSSESSLLTAAQIDERLQEICSRICSKPDTRAGLLELHQFKQDNSKSLVQIEAFISSLGDFFQKYIERGLSRIEAEKTSSDKVAAIIDHSQTAENMESYRQKLLSLKAQMFGTADLEMTPVKANGPDGSTHASPLRARLESPAAKLARFGSPKLAISALAASTQPNGGTPDEDQVISNLKERLARFKQQ